MREKVLNRPRPLNDVLSMCLTAVRETETDEYAGALILQSLFAKKSFFIVICFYCVSKLYYLSHLFLPMNSSNDYHTTDLSTHSD